MENYKKKFTWSSLRASFQRRKKKTPYLICRYQPESQSATSPISTRSETLITYRNANNAKCTDKPKLHHRLRVSSFRRPCGGVQETSILHCLFNYQGRVHCHLRSFYEPTCLLRLLQEIGVKESSPLTLMSNNQLTIRGFNITDFHQRIKHIDIKYNYNRDRQATEPSTSNTSASINNSFPNTEGRKQKIFLILFFYFFIFIFIVL